MSEDQEPFLKLFKRSFPLRVPRRKYEILALQEELARVEDARQVLPKLRKGGIFEWARAFFAKGYEATPLAEKAGALRAAILTAEQDVLEGCLFPLTVYEMAEARHAYRAMLHYLVNRINEKALDEGQRKVEVQEAEVEADQAFRNKIIELSLKRKNEKGGWFPFLTEGDVAGLHWRLATELHTIYLREFVLSEADVKK